MIDSSAVKPFRNIYWRLFLPFAASVILTSLLAWSIGITLLTAALDQRLARQLEHAALVLAEGEYPLTDSLIERLGKLLKAQVILIDQPQSEAPPTSERIPIPLAGGRSFDWNKAHSLNVKHAAIPYKVVIQPLSAGRDARYAAVAIIASLEDVQGAVRSAAVWLGAAAALGLLGLAWLGHRLARSMTVPIQKLAGMAERIAAGDRDVRAPVAPINELGALAAALNTMVARLQIYEQEMAAQNRLAALGELAARIAHEIRNPLTAIKLQVQLLTELLPEDQRRIAFTVLKEVRRLELIVSNTLQLSRSRELHRTITDLSGLGQEITGLIAPQFAHRGITLETHWRTLPLARLDGDQIKQVLLNLLNNAAEALTDGGIIRVSTDYDISKGTIMIAVEDSGPGISAAQRSQLFTAAVSHKADGLGLGLSISREIVERHRGLLLISDSELGGTKFCVQLPVDESR